MSTKPASLFVSADHWKNKYEGELRVPSFRILHESSFYQHNINIRSEFHLTVKHKFQFLNLDKFLCIYRHITLQSNHLNKQTCIFSTKYRTWHSYGRKAILISFRVLIFLAAHDLQSSLNNSSGQTKCIETLVRSFVFFIYV